MENFNANFFPFPEKLKRDYRSNHEEVMKSIRDKSCWKPFNHINPIEKGGLSNFYPSLQAWTTFKNSDENKLPSFDIPTAAKPEDPFWEDKMNSTIHQIEKEVPEKIHFKDAYSHEVLPELTSSVPLYEKGENYYDTDRPIKHVSDELIDQAKIFNNFDQSLSQIAMGNIPKLHHIDNNNNNQQFDMMNSKPKLSNEEVDDLRKSIKMLGMDLEWRIAFQSVMKQLVSHIPKFGIPEMAGNEEQSKIWKQNYDNAMKLIKSSGSGGGIDSRSKYFYGGQQYLNLKPMIQQPSIQQPSIQQPSIQQPSIQQPSIQQKPEIVTEFVEVKTQEGASQFLDLKSSNQIPIMPITYKTYETFPQQEQQAPVSNLLVPQKQPFINTVDESTNTDLTQTETTKKEPFTQKIKEAIKRII